MILKDAEFGEVIVRKNPLSKNVTFKISTSGRLQMSVPQHTSDFLVKRFLNCNRTLIREKIPLSDPRTQRARDAKKKILMKKARDYLPTERATGHFPADPFEEYARCGGVQERACPAVLRHAGRAGAAAGVAGHRQANSAEPDGRTTRQRRGGADEGPRLRHLHRFGL